MSKKTILLLLTSFLSVFLLGIFVSPANAANLPVQGYAWSDNIGWIQFNPTSGGVFLDDSNGNLSGYAWSDNIGWVWFDATDGSHPSAIINNYNTCGSSCAVSGWARAIAADNNGWDGWIKMSDTWSNGVILNKTTGAFSGYAWGSDVVGWVQFDPYVSVAFTPNISISVLPPSQDIAQTDSVGKEYTIRITSLNGFSSAVNLTKVCPSAVGISCSISLTTVTPPANGSVDSKLTVTTSNTPVSNYTLTVTGASGVLTSSASPSLNVVSAAAALAVDLSANPSSGNAPLNDVDLTVNVSGGSGTINYTFYCNRSDSGTNITLPYDAKYDVESATVKTAQDVCDYSSEGAYTAKVIVERGSSSAEDRVTITVTSGADVCPDGICGPAEDCNNCPADCGVCGEDFSLGNDVPIWATIVANSDTDSTRTTIRVLPEGGFTDPVTLSVPSPMPGFQYWFSNNSDTIILNYISGTEYETTEFWVTVPGLTPKGLYYITIQGDGGGLTRQTIPPVELNVEYYNSGWDEF